MKNQNSVTEIRRKKILGIVVDAAMYGLFICQMLYIFTGNLVHEWMGIALFVCLCIHIVLKRHWFAQVLKRSGGWNARRFADLCILLLLLDIFFLFCTSLGVSRTIFPSVHFFESATWHRWLASLGLILAVIHGGMHGYFRAKRKKKAVILIFISAIAAAALGFWAVPYMNRHFRVVEIESSSYQVGDKLTWTSENKPLVVYFTRLGNTNFEDDVDAVSGASLLLADEKRMGNTEFMAKALQSILDCDMVPITLTGEKYPSSYNDTINVAIKEIRDKVRPEIEDIDTSEYDSIILVYPLWWNTIPMPVVTFLENASLSGKTIYAMATQGSSGFGSSVKDIQAYAPESIVLEALSIYCDDIPKCRSVFYDWLIKYNLAVK